MLDSTTLQGSTTTRRCSWHGGDPWETPDGEGVRQPSHQGTGGWGLECHRHPVAWTRLLPDSTGAPRAPCPDAGWASPTPSPAQHRTGRRLGRRMGPGAAPLPAPGPPPARAWLLSGVVAGLADLVCLILFFVGTSEGLLPVALIVVALVLGARERRARGSSWGDGLPVSPLSCSESPLSSPRQPSLLREPSLQSTFVASSTPSPGPHSTVV